MYFTGRFARIRQFRAERQQGGKLNYEKNDIRTLTRLALLVAIELVMKAVGLGSVPVGPLYMSFLTLPIAVGAITMGPAAALSSAACSAP